MRSGDSGNAAHKNNDSRNGPRNDDVAPADMTLEELRLFLAPTIAQEAIFDGWSKVAVGNAARQHGVDEDVAQLAFPGGAVQMVDAWTQSIDAAMLAHFSAEALAQLPIRERIRSLVQFRLDAAAGLEEAQRRASAIMVMPQNAPRSLRIGWRSADMMWRLAGDVATDYNHYSKRSILLGIYAGTLAIFVDDDSADKAETRAFLDRRIEGVMKFEKAKAKLLNSERETFSITRFLGRLRYPAR